MDVSIIIVNYNTCNLTRNCLTSVFEQTHGIDFEVIVSDNGSEDGSIEMIKKEFPQVILIENNENLGFGAANNRGYIIAKGKYLFLLNSDTLLLNNAVKYFYEYMEKLPTSEACCGCILQDKDGNEIHSYGDFHTLLNCLCDRIWHKLSYKYDNPRYRRNDSFRVPFVTGADLFVRKSVADKLGLFDEDFFMYSEDVELQKRYFNHGFYSSITIDPKIIHLVGGSNIKTKLSKAENSLKSIFLYQKKELSNFKYFMFRFVFKFFYCPIVLTKPKYSMKDKISHIRNVIKLKP